MSEEWTQRALAESALSHISPDCERPVWVRMAMAIKSEFGDAGFDLWNDWSKRGASYNAADARAVWRSIKSGGGVTVATLFHIASRHDWQPGDDFRPPSREEMEARRRRQEQEADRERRRTARRHSQVAARAAASWQSAEPVEGRNHPYLAKKGVNAYGLRRARLWERRTRSEDGQWQTVYIKDVLLIPMSDAGGQLWNLQAIFPKQHPALGRDKDYLSGGRTAGLFFRIPPLTGGRTAGLFFRIPPLTGGQNQSGTGTLLIAEGYATGAALFEATGYTTFVSFSAGNLEAVARIVRDQYPAARLVLCADNDLKTPGNPGLAAAHRAARAVHGVVAVPPIGGDFCDWRQALRQDTENE